MFFTPNFFKTHTACLEGTPLQLIVIAATSGESPVSSNTFRLTSGVSYFWIFLRSCSSKVAILLSLHIWRQCWVSRVLAQLRSVAPSGPGGLDLPACRRASLRCYHGALSAMAASVDSSVIYDAASFHVSSSCASCRSCQYTHPRLYQITKSPARFQGSSRIYPISLWSFSGFLQSTSINCSIEYFQRFRFSFLDNTLYIPGVSYLLYWQLPDHLISLTCPFYS